MADTSQEASVVCQCVHCRPNRTILTFLYGGTPGPLGCNFEYDTLLNILTKWRIYVLLAWAGLRTLIRTTTSTRPMEKEPNRCHWRVVLSDHASHLRNQEHLGRIMLLHDLGFFNFLELLTEAPQYIRSVSNTHVRCY